MRISSGGRVHGDQGAVVTWLPLRGRAVVRELKPESILVLPDDSPREVKTHRGVVLALGPPAWKGDREVPWECEVGDVVQYHWEKQERAWTLPWTDGKPAAWLHQHEIDAVVEDMVEIACIFCKNPVAMSRSHASLLGCGPVHHSGCAGWPYCSCANAHVGECR
jgi:co-chaperonin GroES (HSP10)